MGVSGFMSLEAGKVEKVTNICTDTRSPAAGGTRPGPWPRQRQRFGVTMRLRRGAALPPQDPAAPHARMGRSA